MKKNLFWTFLILTLSFTSGTALGATSYKWFGLNLNLPFPKKWVANKKARKKSKDPYVFFEDVESPRIAGTLYHTNYDLNPKDYSAFETTFLKSKMKWLKKEDSALLGKIITNPPKSQGGAFSYEFSFRGTRGIFKEVGVYRRCKQKSFTLKAILPKSKWDTKQGKEIQDYILFSDPCPSHTPKKN